MYALKPFTTAISVRSTGDVFRWTKNVEKAEDYTQDIFMRTFARLDRFQERSSFSTWLYSISFNYCLEQIKWSNRLVRNIAG